jgi:ankyrin repeat protein
MGCNLKTRVTRNEIYYNWIEDAAGHEMDLLGADRFHQDPGLEKIIREDSDVVGNVFVKSGYSPIGCVCRMGSDGTGVGEGRYRWVNNTIILRADYPADRSVFRVQDAVESIQMHNNVIYHLANKPVRLLTDWKLFEGVTYQVHGTNNCLPRGSTDIPKGLVNTIFTENPKFTDAEKFNFIPQPKSPLIAAAAQPTTPKDFPAFHKPLVLPKFTPPLRTLVGFKPIARTARKTKLDIGAIPFAPNVPAEIPWQSIFVPPITVTANSEIHTAAENGDLERVRSLIKQDPALANARFEDRTPLNAAAVDGHIEIVKLLLAHGADVNGRDGAGCSSLYGAAFRGHTAIARLLIEHGANVNFQSKHGQTALFVAAQFNRHSRVVELLLKHGADINLADRERWTPLHAAVATGTTEIVQTLVAANANINAQNSWGQTPLHLAIIYNRPDVAKLLLARKPDLTLRTTEGKTPLQLAKQLEAKEILALLNKHSAKE